MFRQLLDNSARRFVAGITFLLLLSLAACTAASATPTPTRFSTLRGETLVPVGSVTPYIRPTDDPTLNLDTPIVKVGDETITLGQFRARVRFDRFSALDSARRMIERVGLDKLNLAAPGANPTGDAIASIFNTLAHSDSFGQQVYANMVSESIIRQEFQARKLTVDPIGIRGYWIQLLDLQQATNVDVLWPLARDQYITSAENYSGISADAINQIADAWYMSNYLEPIIGKENMPELTVTKFHIRHILTHSQADADAALAQLKQGQDFRNVACQYSVDPSAKGNSGSLGLVTRSQMPVGFSSDDLDTLFQAKPGDVVGPIQSPLGWTLFKVNAQSKDTDGNVQLDIQMLQTMTESQANTLKDQIKQGADFAALACENSSNQGVGNGGDLGYVTKDQLPDEVVKVIEASTSNGFFGPVATKNGFEVVEVVDRQNNVPKPADVDQAVSQAFVDWENNRANSSYVTALSSIWQSAIPVDPLPRDVSPLMNEANFGLPTPEPTVIATAVGTAATAPVTGLP